MSGYPSQCPCPPPGQRSACFPIVSGCTQSPCCPVVPGIPPITCPPNCCSDTGCPRGYKPCIMSMCPPPNCDPRGVWMAHIEKCPPTPQQKY